MIQIRQIGRDDPLYRQEQHLREVVLLHAVGLDMDSFMEQFPGVEERFIHFVAVFDHPVGERVIGCALLLVDHPEPGTGQIMQVAVDPQRQGEGIGRQLIIAIEHFAFATKGLGELICHARNGAIGFYRSLGWAIDSDEFIEVGIPHHQLAIRAGNAQSS